jgi:peptidoglycan/xylan/chitin deacetylase (PgdA/CDA1 family)
MTTASDLYRALRGRLSKAKRLVRSFAPRPCILMYHRINSAACDPWGLVVSPANFDDQLAWLKRHRTVLPLSEFARLHRSGALPARAVAITFDDGYACNALAAAPMLADHGLPATFFLTTDAISSPREFWWDDLERILFETEATEVDVAVGEQRLMLALGAAGPHRRAWRPFESADTPWRAAYMTLWSAVRGLDPQTRIGVLDELRRQCGAPQAARASHRAMTLEELREVAQRPNIEIGAHSLTHPNLGGWSDEVQHAEIEGSRRACAEMVGRTPVNFAYPFGEYSARTVEIVRDIGFEAACTTEAAAVGRRTDPLKLPRLQVQDFPGAGLAPLLGAA